MIGRKRECGVCFFSPGKVPLISSFQEKAVVPENKRQMVLEGAISDQGAVRGSVSSKVELSFICKSRINKFYAQFYMK